MKQNENSKKKKKFKTNREVKAKLNRTNRNFSYLTWTEHMYRQHNWNMKFEPGIGIDLKRKGQKSWRQCLLYEQTSFANMIWSCCSKVPYFYSYSHITPTSFSNCFFYIHTIHSYIKFMLYYMIVLYIHTIFNILFEQIISVVLLTPAINCELSWMAVASQF